MGGGSPIENERVMWEIFESPPCFVGASQIHFHPYEVQIRNNICPLYIKEDVAIFLMVECSFQVLEPLAIPTLPPKWYDDHPCHFHMGVPPLPGHDVTL